MIVKYKKLLLNTIMKDYLKFKKDDYLLTRNILRLILFLWAIFIMIAVINDSNIRGFYRYTILLVPFFLIILFESEINDKYQEYKKGVEGESAVQKELLKISELKGCFTYNDITLPDSNWNIDHLIVSRKGIFVIETKNHSGVYKVDGENWYKKEDMIFSKFKPIKKNPMIQARLNALTLQKYLFTKTGLKNIYITPIVVLVNKYKQENINTPDLIIAPNMISNAVYSTELTQDKNMLIAVKNVMDDLTSTLF